MYEDFEFDFKEKKPHKWRKRIGMLLLFVIVAVGAFFGGQCYLLSQNSDGISNLSIMKKLFVLEAYVDHYYLNDVDEKKVADSVYSGFMEGLEDPYSVYYTEEEYNQLMEEDSGEYEGIGVTVYKDTDTEYVLIDQVYKDQPAYNAGIQSGDILTAVDGKDTKEMTLEETVNAIKKSENDTVALTIFRDNKTTDISVEKTSIEIETVTYKMKKNNIGYISVSQFIENTGNQFCNAIDDLEEQGMKGLIIDLRDNGGGLLNTCLAMVSRIIPKDELIVYTEDKNGKKEEYNSDSEETLDIPIVILVNGNSASASEIMTGCLKDYGKATIVGTTTFGKGIVQNIMELPDGSAVKMTVSKYYTPKGNYIHDVGIEPDVTVEMTTEEWAAARKDASKDTQLKKAMEILTK